jgi:integrase
MIEKLQDVFYLSCFEIKNNIKRSFYAACREAGIKEGGIKGQTLHNLRHSAASNFVREQMPIQMVGRILGISIRKQLIAI